MKNKLLAALPLLALAACATPESRIETRLLAAGFGQRNAHCLAGELVHRLSYGQLRRLNDVAKDIQQSERSKKLTVNDLARRLNEAGDPQLIVEVTRAGLGCAILKGF